VSGGERSRIWFEILALYLGSCFVIRGIKMLQEGFGLPDDVLVLVALVFIYTPWVAEKWRGYYVDDDILRPEPLRPALLKGLRFFVIVIAVIYPFFLLGNHLWQTMGFTWFTDSVLGWTRPYRPHFPTHGLPDDLLMQVLYQLICVGYAEEYFYRGYMQTRMNEVFDGRRFRLLGAEFGWALPVTAILFTAGHSIVTFQWWQPFIIFPALIFGWMRARSGNIIAGTLFHAWSNSVMIVLDSLYGVKGA
jgi:hypothetical protein